MREIKFRVWNKELKIMDYGNGELVGVNKFDASAARTVNDIINQNYPELEWMQYTGLKDKNGTEIYGGDIVKFGEDEVLYEVYQHDSGSWEARGLSLWEWISENGNENEWEVIGNIYENPGLLEGKAGMGKQKSATEIIEEVREEICDKYCKHRDKALRGNEIGELCNKCPLNKL